ncbi:MAG: 5-amino-6-(D-ribitylamino)uracil--L-tyrosine 4-hydroxyphenyl transferase CofH [Candidatus Binatia bacterium]|nr:5-amino-6-(D-ribitylamino)uracil--L-tyrosine 4-hydroxyphenyl transferase CofH [Candidatus Binatia bacterium]
MLNYELRSLIFDTSPVEKTLRDAHPEVARLLDRALSGHELSAADGLRLLAAEGPDLRALLRAADVARQLDVGDEVTYVVNRNINFTNVCFVGCQFCAFARHRKDADARTDSVETILAKVAEAVERGATEICMQGGINPEMPPLFYRDLLIEIKRVFPTIHIHAFSPMEIFYGARRAGMPYREYLTMLREAGLGTIPGTAAEILDDDVRDILSHKKVDVRSWIEIVTTAHKVGLRSSSTMMYGHIEKPHHILQHIEILRSIQRETGGFTEFVPLRFIHTYTALYQKGLVNPPPKGSLDLKIYAFSRLMLRPLIVNIQTSWVKLGTELAQWSLATGCNDFGGTLMEEQISKSAGADAGEYLPVEAIHSLILGMNRIPQERTTTYGRVSRSEFDTDPGARWGRRSRPLPSGASLVH